MHTLTLSIVSVLALTACSSMNTSSSKSERDPAKASPQPNAKATAKKVTTVFPYEVQRAMLDNGLEVLMIPMPSDGLVSYWSIVRTGSRDEVEQGVTGFAHFFEHMMFRGSKRFPAREYDAIVNGMGADANAFTTDDFTAFHLSFAKPDLAKVIEIEADRFANLEYDESQFKTESGAVYGEYRKGRTSPFEVLFESIQNTAFDKHTYKHTTIGFEADIQKMPEQFQYSKGFFQRFYRPENVVVVVTGDFDPKSTLEAIRTQYGAWKKGYIAPQIPVEPPQMAQRRVDVPFEGKTLPYLAVNFKGDALKPTDRTMMAATLIGELAFGATSKLYKKLVLDDQRVEMLLSNFEHNRDPGLWSVITKVKDPTDVKAIENEIWSTISDLQKNLIDAQRLNAVRSHIKYGFLSELSTPTQVAESLARTIAITGDMQAVEQMYTTLDTVTPEDVRKAAQTYLTRERSTVAVLHTKDVPIPASSNERGVAREASASAAGAAVQAPALMPVAQDPNVAFKIWFQVGSQDDPPGKEGLAALTGAMISEGGSAKLPYEAILERLFPLAAAYSASVDKEMTLVAGTVHRDNVDRFYELLSEAIVTPGFRNEDFERLRDQTISMIEKTLRYSSDEELGKATLHERVFAGTPYGHLDAGNVASLRAMKLADVKAFYKSHFTRDNVVVGLGGAFSKGLPEKVQADLARLPAGKPVATPAPKPAAITGRNAVLVEKAGPSTAISFGFPIDLHRGTRDYYAMWIANSWLGEHRNSSSHLYQVIRETRGMNYGDYSYIEAFPHGGQRTMPPTGVGRRQQMFEVWVRPVPREQALFAMRAALREVDNLAKNGLTREQFEFTRKFLKNYSLHFAETTTDRLGYAVDDRYFGTNGHLAQFRKMMDEITFEEVNAAIKKYLQVDNVDIALVTADAAGLKQAIVSDAPSAIDYKGVEKPKEVLEEDKIIERYPLRIPEANITIVPVDKMFAGDTHANG